MGSSSHVGCSIHAAPSGALNGGFGDGWGYKHGGPSGPKEQAPKSEGRLKGEVHMLGAAQPLTVQGLLILTRRIAPPAVAPPSCPWHCGWGRGRG